MYKITTEVSSSVLSLSQKDTVPTSEVSVNRLNHLTAQFSCGIAHTHSHSQKLT
jgi:hypothetical protein